MKLYLTFATLLSAILFISCDKTYDCTCVVKGTQAAFVQEISAENADDGRDKCLEYRDNYNRTTIPGVDCDIQ